MRERERERTSHREKIWRMAVKEKTVEVRDRLIHCVEKGKKGKKMRVREFKREKREIREEI